MIKKTVFREMTGPDRNYNVLMIGLLAGVGVGLLSAFNMETAGHHITGMSNRIVWGLPHVFAVFLILTAAGAINPASIASIMGRKMYQPLARLSAVLAASLLAGGLMILVLDLGRPDRLIRSIPILNFDSIFALNIFVYSSFFLACVLSLWIMIERKMVRYTKAIGTVAFLIRLLLATDIGSVFGVLAARQAYDSAVMAPMFVVLSFAFGTAAYIVVMILAMYMNGRPVGAAITRRLARTMGVFLAIGLYFVAMQHITNLYSSAHQGVSEFILFGDNVYSTLFWWAQIGLGTLAPLAIITCPKYLRCPCMVLLAAGLVLIGGFTQIYVIIIGGQAYPLLMFPGMEVTSSFFDGQIAAYTPSLVEALLGIGGGALSLTLVALAIKVLPILPMTMADADIDPHYTPPLPPEPEPEPESVEKEEDEAPEATASS
ncbi:MAG: polysulfide reductase NrfD [Rhodospirillales bacterium]|nr:polysulfide reductase NrfD [Rhodospirillales bacterium]